MDKATKAIKPKKCKAPSCRAEFIPTRPLQSVCSPSCAFELVGIDKAKKQAQEATRKRVEHRKAVDKLKTRKDWMREAQIAFNSWIRGRDEGLPCISCGSFTGKINAGHYRSVGSSPELRFEPENCHRQCEKCNSYLSGNLINYRINLIKRIGLDRVEWLESKHEPRHYDIETLKGIKEAYKQKLRNLK